MTLEQEKQALDIEKTRVEITQIRASAHHINAQIRKLERETKFLPLIVGSGIVVAIAGIVRLFL